MIKMLLAMRNFLLSFNLWIIVFLFYIGIIINRRIKDYLYILRTKEAKNITYNETEIIAHLNMIVGQVLDNYVIFHININEGIDYISSDMQSAMIDYMSEKVSSRISATLHNELSLLYNENEIGTVIGELIYMAVNAYAVEFNRAKEVDKRQAQSKYLEKK